ncbi:MAG: hypothetical protein ACFCUM_05940 [Bacteroidales bacterium]
MDERIFLPDVYELKSNVLRWLNTLRIGNSGFEYKFSPGTSSSLFTTCFALYILDLFKETDNLSLEEKKEWTNYINSFQSESDGLFYPNPQYHPDKERDVFQASCFCLSALSILESKPKYRISIVDQWRTRDNVEQYLKERGCHLGKSGSGNKAMFQAILLTHEYERDKDHVLLESINSWFDFHDRFQNSSGFWGKGRQGRLYKGLQNALHQFVIYEYWNRNYPRIEQVAQTALKLNDQEGFFSHLPGGDSCKEYDSLHLLLYFYKDSLKLIEPVLEKAIGALITRWNEDGGFCENPTRPFKSNYTQLMAFIFNAQNNEIRITRGINVLKEIIKPKKHNTRKWIKESQPWSESTLWDTWFRCLSIAEISCFIDSNYYKRYRFHKHIGLGFNHYKQYNSFLNLSKYSFPERN